MVCDDAAVLETPKPSRFSQPELPASPPEIGLQTARPGSARLAASDEDPRYLSDQLLTYLGNKRALLGLIRGAVEHVRAKTGRDELQMLDAFSGSGVVSRMFKQYSSRLVANDIEDYARVVSSCYLANRSTVPFPDVEAAVDRLNRAVDAEAAPSGFFRRMYAPRDAANITPEDRVFYTPENAYRLDAYRQLIEDEDAALRPFLLGPLLSAASIHANTAGVFKGFYKDRDTGAGKFGGSGSDALSRITAPVVLRPPVLSRFECDFEVRQEDANSLVKGRDGFDVAYLDPPYNQHPYGSNYFMLNLLVNYEEPTEVSRVSGIPTDWTRSDYNVKRKSLPRLRELILEVEADFVILSFSDDGYIHPEEMREVLYEAGSVTEEKRPHATFRGSRNLRNRSLEVNEHVYLVEKR
ncbi:MAG TPA: DNA adenine methylase [Solirubrobacterales bacterium]|nr:DNA adenine methylase [Solirubrobacterales bacterium]